MADKPVDIRPSGNLRVLHLHLEELAFLWGQRQHARHSPDFTARDLEQLERRISAHVDGLHVGGEPAIALLAAQLGGDDPATIFAAALTLLEMKTSAAAAPVIEAFVRAGPEKVNGFRQALCQGPIDIIERQLRDAATTAPALVAVVALEALVFHGRPPVAKDRWPEYAEHKDPAVRRAAWRIAAMVDGSGG